METLKWLEWDDDAFEKARLENKPILLTIVASWCRWCKSMEETVFTAEATRGIIEREYVAIRVDKDKRPDINERYNMGGWPSCAILNSDGEVITAAYRIAVHPGLYCHSTPPRVSTHANRSMFCLEAFEARARARMGCTPGPSAARCQFRPSSSETNKPRLVPAKTVSRPGFPSITNRHSTRAF